MAVDSTRKPTQPTQWAPNAYRARYHACDQCVFQEKVSCGCELNLKQHTSESASTVSAQSYCCTQISKQLSNFRGSRRALRTFEPSDFKTAFELSLLETSAKNFRTFRFQICFRTFELQRTCEFCLSSSGFVWLSCSFGWLDAAVPSAGSA